MKQPSRCVCGPTRQRGISLVTTLLFMLAALVLGVSVMGVNVMQERMLGNAKDRDLAFQAAEATLRDGELDVMSNLTQTSAFNDACISGLCTAPTQRATVSPLPVHLQPGFSWIPADGKVRTYGQMSLLPAIPSVVAQPTYVVENLGVMGCGVGCGGNENGSAAGETKRYTYRITARANGARAETVVMLQSVFFK